MRKATSVHAVLTIFCLIIAIRAFSGQDAVIVASPSVNIATSDIPQLQFEKHVLSNGLQLILYVDKKLPVVHVNEFFHVGSKDEKPGRTGFAHLFEHMMFQGSQNASGDYFRFVEKAGANLREGGVNGTTGKDRTNYFATVPSGNLEYILWLESDRLATLLDGMTQEKLDKQRDVVKNERRMGIDNQPYGRIGELIPAYLYPPDHPYSWPVIGNHEDLTAATLDDVKDFFRRYYSTNNLSMVIAGDFDPAEALRLVEKYYGSIPPGPPQARLKRWVPRLDGEKIVEVNDKVPHQRLYITWNTPAHLDPEETEIDLAGGILGDGVSCRFYKTLVYDKQLCFSISSYQNPGEICGIFQIIAQLSPGASMTVVESVIAEEISRLARDGPSDAELERVKTCREHSFIVGLERIGGFGGKADLLNTYNVLFGNPDKYKEGLLRLRRADKVGVQAACKKWLDNSNCLKVRFYPDNSSSTAKIGIDRSLLPALGKDTDFTPPLVKSTVLDNGLEVIVVERHELPKVAVSILSKLGCIHDPPQKTGLASFLAEMILKGTKTRSTLQIADAFANLGTSIGAYASLEYSAVGFEAVKRNLSAGLEIMSDIVLHPDFPPEEIDRVRKLLCDSISQTENDPNGISGRVGSILLFGRDHPYGRPITGFSSTIENISREDLFAMHARGFNIKNCAVFFIGDITLEEAKAAAQKAFNGFPPGVALTKSVPEIKTQNLGRVFVVDKPGAAQTIISQILPGLPRAHPDFYRLGLADVVWGGGGFGTRLMLNLRENKGYTYRVRSYSLGYSAGGIWFATSAVQTGKTKESIAEFTRELENLAGKKPISLEELMAAKTTRVRGFAQKFETSGQISSKICELWSMGIPFTEIRKEYDETSRLASDEVNAAAAKYATPEKRVYLLVGDAQVIVPAVKALNLGDPVLLNPKGEVINYTK